MDGVVYKDLSPSTRRRIESLGHPLCDYCCWEVGEFRNACQAAIAFLGTHACGPEEYHAVLECARAVIAANKESEDLAQ
jgi:hypothetical protein